MTSITEQAQTIRDATTAGENTALRVGGCLVDMANQIGPAAGFVLAPVTTTPVPTNDIYPVLTDFCYEAATSVELVPANPSGFRHFVGLLPSRVYLVTFDIGFQYDDTVDLGFSIRTADNNAILPGSGVNTLVGKGFTRAGLQNMVVSGLVTGVGTCGLFVHGGAASTSLVLNRCVATIKDVGAAAV